MVQAAGNYIVAFNNAGANSAFTLHDGSTLTGMLIQQVSGGAMASGITVSCPTRPSGGHRQRLAGQFTPGGAGTSLANGMIESGTCNTNSPTSACQQHFGRPGGELDQHGDDRRHNGTFDATTSARSSTQAR